MWRKRGILMAWWVWLLIGFGVLVAWEALKGGTAPAKAGARADPAPAPGAAQELADSITTYRELRALERKLERAEDNPPGSEAAYDRWVQRTETMQAAIDICGDRVFRWQFSPPIELDTPLEQLKASLRFVDAADFEVGRGVIGDREHWYPLKGLDEGETMDDREDTYKGVVRFRTIVESDATNEEKAKSISRMKRSYPEFVEEFFDPDRDLGEQWLEDEAKRPATPSRGATT